MPRTARASRGDVCYHVMNRGNARADVFHDPADYQTFLELTRRACLRLPMRVLAYCLMPNHFHFVLWPRADGDLGSWMHWLLTAHVHRHRLRHDTVGRIWQGRFKAFPIQRDEHLLTVLRYVERNPIRAGLVPRALDWPWTSAAVRGSGRGLLHPPPVELPPRWDRWLEEPLTPAEVEAVRRSARRDRPYGDAAWIQGTAERLGLTESLRPRGRPRGVGLKE